MPTKINRPSAGLIYGPRMFSAEPASPPEADAFRQTGWSVCPPGAPAPRRDEDCRNARGGVLETAAQQQLARVGMKISLAHYGRVGKAPEIMPEQRQRRRERRLAAPIGMNRLEQFGPVIGVELRFQAAQDRKSTRLNSSHGY